MTLKTKNMPLLVAFLIGQAALLLIVLGNGSSPVLQDWKGGSAAASIAMVVAFVLSDVLGDVSKARLVFWRWSNPLPGCSAFSRHMHEDDRIDPACLERKHGPLPTDAAQQNRLWFTAVFKQHRDKPSLTQAHARYLLLRELTAISAILAVALSAVALVVSSGPAAWKAIYVAFLIVQYVVIAQAGANAGVRMVKNALAEECA